MPLFSENFLYEVNISCHESKLDWVEEHLLPMLEAKLRLKCFLFERDKPAGFSPSQIIQCTFLFYACCGSQTSTLSMTLSYSVYARSRGRIQSGAMRAIAPFNTYDSNFIHHDFVQIREQHLRLKVILSSIVLSQQCCEVYFISLTVEKPLWDLTTKYYWNRPPYYQILLKR